MPYQGLGAGMVLIVFLLALAPHVHDPILPAPRELWNSCCHEQDCRQAQISARSIGDDYIVSVADYPPVRVKGDRVYRSENGKSYICTQLGELPPTNDNVLCVFLAGDNYI